MSTISEVAVDLTKALASAKSAHDALDKAKTTLAPLEAAAKEADNAVTTLMKQYQSLAMPEAPEWVGGRGRRAGAKKGPYNIDPSRKVEAVYKRTLTRLTNQGVSEKEATKQAKATSEALAKKLGIK